MLFDGLARRAFSLGGDGTAEAQKDPAPTRRLRVGLALGGGAARGWAHIGVLRVLDAAGIRPDMIAGCSIGAVVGGCYAAGKLAEIESFALSLTKRRVMGLLDFHLGGSGLIAGGRLQKLLEFDLGRLRVENLPIRFGTVATELVTGHEIWLTRGSLVDALRASYALPGVFSPVRLGGRWLMDGALVNPVPVTVARAFGADVVICVNLNNDIRLRGTVIPDHGEDEEGPLDEAAGEPPRSGLFSQWLDNPARRRERRTAPGMASVMIDAFNITQDRISRSRLAGDPPDAMVSPKLAGIGLFEFHRAAEAIELGRQSAERALPDILEMMDAALAVPGAAKGSLQAVAM
ncbi:patatin-like phospholipase family protein [Enterovirga aerilata]|uniref:NTE family protein rssA n=1 Tax=Enterovirga aerilata TaxID=2730920 RepID=A0A849I0I3_9HYPH|nr:patatin-like phospholipase family protein [Enterovirga sp. DB1703]NNM73266.1 NTE family protein rssA [Enterovirga sp. DB1703]